MILPYINISNIQKIEIDYSITLCIEYKSSLKENTMLIDTHLHLFCTKIIGRSQRTTSKK